MQWRMLLGALATIAVGATLATAGPASADIAGTGTIQDSTHEVQDPRGDISSASVSYLSGTITVSVTTVEGENPVGSPNWTMPPDSPQGCNRTTIRWLLDADGADPADFSVGFGACRGALSAAVDNGPGTCEATPRYDGDRTYSASFPASCIGSPPRLRWSARMSHYNAGGDFREQDSAPDARAYADFVTPGVAPPPPAPRPTAPPVTAPRAAPATTTSPATVPAPAPTSTTTPPPSTSTTAAPATTAPAPTLATSTPPSLEVAARHASGGTSAGLVAGLVLGALAAGGAAFALGRRSSHA